MKAIVQDAYGAADAVLELQEIDKPAVKDDEVRVRVHAASVHIGDWLIMRGDLYVLRLATGLLRPKQRVPGGDIAGTVEAVGNDVKRFQPGDEVFGWCQGGFAEFASAAEDHFVLKPANVTFEQAAAVGGSAFTALHAVRDQAKVQPGQKVLINGASGGVGTFSVQMAKSFGAEVTGVCSTRNVFTVRSIGADHVIDYTQEDFTQSGQRYDFILDIAGNRSLSDYRRVLTPDGTLIPIGGPASLSRPLKMFVVSLFVRQQGRPFVSMANSDDLVVLKKLVDSGDIKPVIDRTYPLSETPEALRYIGEGHARGKIVIQMISGP